MPSRKAKNPKLRTIEKIDQDWRHGCQYGWEGIVFPTDEELRRLRKRKQDAERAATIAAARADFDDTVDAETWAPIEAERRRAQNELKAFDQEVHELKAWIGRANATKAKEQRQAALIKEIQGRIKQWWGDRTKEDRKQADWEKRIEKRKSKECSTRNLTKMLCAPKKQNDQKNKEPLDMTKWKFFWRYKDKKETIPFRTLSRYVEEAKR